MRQFYPLILFLFPFSATSGQVLDKAYIDRCACIYDTTLEIKPDMFYVIDGIPFEGHDTIVINKALRQISIKRLLSVYGLKPISQFMDGGKGAIVVTSVIRQSKGIKKELLVKARERFVDSHISISQQSLMDFKDPVLYIDSRLISQPESKKEIYRLKLTSIYAIQLINGSDPSIFCVKYSKNGVIWTLKAFKD